MSDYHQKFLKIKEESLFKSLDQDTQSFIEKKAHQLRLTFQELRVVINIAIDLHMWDEGNLKDFWPIEDEAPILKHTGKMRAKIIIQVFTDKWLKLQEVEKEYSKIPMPKTHQSSTPEIVVKNEEKMALGRCPVASDKTLCCMLHTLDVVKNCGLDCSYCCIQSFFHDNKVFFDSNFGQKLKNLKLDPNLTYHIGTGQSSDSLMWGNHLNILDDLVEFARANPNVILELKTKVADVQYFKELQGKIPPNIICTWTLNSDTIIAHEEHLTSSVESRLEAARAAADYGMLVGFHFHPMVYYKNWEADYAKIANMIMDQFVPDEIAMISFGTITFIRSVINKIRKRNFKSKILQMPLVEAAGKLSYPKEIKIKMFSHIHNCFLKWHQEVFFYLCMEDQEIWMPSIGTQYSSNEEFEEDMKRNYLGKIKKLYQSN